MLSVNPLTPIKEEDEDVSPFQKKKDKRIPLLLSTKGKRIK